MALTATLKRIFRTRFPLLFSPLSSPFSSSPLTDFTTEPITLSTPPNLSSFVSSISDAKSQSSSHQEALAVLRSSTTSIEPTKDLLCSALWELRSDWESAALAFKWARDHVSEWPAAWHMMIWVLGNEKRFDLAWSLLRKMKRKSRVTRTAMVILMERYAAAGEVSKATKTFYAMEKFKIEADTSTFYALVRALCKNRNVEEAEQLLLLNRKFYPLETEGFNIILDGWCNIIIDLVEAKRVWKEMLNCCIAPDDASFSHMIFCFSKVGNLCDSLRLYDQMKSRGFVPNLAIYNSLIYALTRESCWREARKMFDKILESGMKPDIETYNSMICPLCDARKVEEAREIMDEMVKNGIQPTTETYTAFAKGEDIEGTLKVLERMKEVGYGPDSYIFLLILDKFFKLHESASALRIWSEMSTYHVVPDSSHYTTLVQGLAAHGWIPKAMEFYTEMRSKGFPADPKLEKLFQTFISNSKNHWGRGKEYIISTRRGDIKFA